MPVYLPLSAPWRYLEELLVALNIDPVREQVYSSTPNGSSAVAISFATSRLADPLQRWTCFICLAAPSRPTCQLLGRCDGLMELHTAAPLASSFNFAGALSRDNVAMLSTTRGCAETYHLMEDTSASTILLRWF